MNAPAGSHLGPQGPLSHRLLDFQGGRQHMAKEAVSIMHLMNLYSQLFFFLCPHPKTGIQTAHLKGESFVDLFIFFQLKKKTNPDPRKGCQPSPGNGLLQHLAQLLNLCHPLPNSGLRLCEGPAQKKKKRNPPQPPHPKIPKKL